MMEMNINWFDIVATLAKMAFLFGFCLAVLPPTIWFERRGCAWIQGRVGPNRVGPFGLFQPLADVLKLFLKENFIPDHVNKFYYLLAPFLVLLAPFLAIMTIPFGSSLILAGQEIPLQLVHFDAGLMIILAFTGLEVYPVMLAGWASKNKYGTLGALRAASQFISYEIAMGMAILSMVVVYGTFNMREMVEFQQTHYWGVLLNPIAAFIFWVCIFAETNRAPFDLPEGDSEIVAGYFIEYGGMKFALFYMAEYIAMLMASMFIATLFFGGFALLPGMDWIATQLASDNLSLHNVRALLEAASLFIKVGFFMFVYIWVRWTLPRFRFDQVMHLGWKILLPLSLVNLALMTVVAYFIG